jgi:poly-gamma-glutamate biosynthesis protein PgsC/CapC
LGIEATFIGLVTTLLFIGVTGIYPGGIIVPAYLILFLQQPERLVGTLAAALLTWACYRAASRFLILFGRRRLVFMILVGGIWTLLATSVLPVLLPASMEFRVIGWVIPGLIANHFERQGILVTSAALVTVVIAIFFITRMVTAIF